MRVSIFLTLLLLAGVTYTSAQVRYSRSYDGSVTFADNIVSFESYGGSFLENKTLPYRIEEVGRVRYLIAEDQKFLLLTNDSLLFLIDSKGETFMAFNDKSVLGESMYSEGKYFMASSHLEERNRSYFAGNMSRLRSNSPWVEGESNNGIGVQIKVVWDVPISSLIVVNGFISFDKPSLFLANNRVRRIAIRDTFGKSYDRVLSDTPEPQIILLEQATSGVDIVVQETYSGDKYDDTCISFIGGISDRKRS